MTFTLALSGDSMITRRGVVSDTEKARGLQQLMQAADVTFTNLEVVATDVEGFHSSGAFTPTLTAPAHVLEELHEYGVDVAAFANNHTMNLGIEGMLDTAQGLRQRGVACAGVGRSLGEASMPAYVSTPAGTVAVVACTATFASGEEATRPSDTMRGRPGLNPLRHSVRMGVTETQLSALAETHAELGLDDQINYLREMRFLPEADGTDHLLFGGTFFETETPRVESTCAPSDLARICHWVKEAKRRSHIAVVSIHSHENGSTLTEPADFFVDFAHAVIDAGADVVVGHGPHRVRGIEIYNRRPIFYSLGNFVGQFELMSVLSSHTYDVLGVPDDLAPHQVLGGNCLGFADHEEYWRSFVPVLQIDGSELVGIEIHPIGQGFDLPAPVRGRPMLASSEEADAVMEDLERLSARFGTTFIREGDGATIKLGA